MAILEKQKEETIKHLERIGYLRSSKIKKALKKVNREQFVLPEYKDVAYADTPLPIGCGQTISAPHMYVIMFEAVKLKKGQKVLEIGTGSGYGAALIREIVGKKGKVVTIEIVPEVCEFAKNNLKKAGYKDVEVICGDGSQGYEKEAPYDVIIVTAACPEIPKPLIEQLKKGGILIAPVGGISAGQDLICLEKTKEGKIIRKNLGGVIFVPLVGRFGYKF